MQVTFRNIGVNWNLQSVKMKKQTPENLDFADGLTSVGEFLISERLNWGYLIVCQCDKVENIYGKQQANTHKNSLNCKGWTNENFSFKRSSIYFNQTVGIFLGTFFHIFRKMIPRFAGNDEKTV